MMKPEAARRPLRVGLISLGCAKNLVDAEIMLGALLQDGMEIINDAATADVVIVNTCSFIDAAQEESVDTILESAALREAKSRGQGLIVSGCLPQRFRDELPKLLPEVDAFMGIDQVAQVAGIVKQAWARRGLRVEEHRTSNLEPRTAKVSERLAELEEGRPAARSEKSQSLRGTGKFGRTKTIVAPLAPLETEAAHGAERRHGWDRERERERGRGGGAMGGRELESPLLEVNVRPNYIPDVSTPRFRLTPRHFAYVKIAEGCNHPCSFCIIPRMRGSHRSRRQADIVAEARRLLAEGVKELNLISQDSTYYGLDLRANYSRAISSPEKFSEATGALPADATTLCSLLRELNALPGEFWIRLLYTHPAHWTDELIGTIAACRKVARYVDIPLQHIHPNMLERMRRETSREHIVDLLRRIRAGVPGIALRTTFIVGFPGETEACFRSLLEFIRETKFERLGVFAFSREEGTRAGAMAGQVSDRVKRRRRDLAMAAQRDLAREISRGCVGRTLKVLVEGGADDGPLADANARSWEHGLLRKPTTQDSKLRTQDCFVARGEADAPDIDGRIYVRGRLRAGEFACVKIVGHTDYDLLAEAAA